MGKPIDRAQKILLAPKVEWPVIAAEPDTTAGIYKGYIVLLAAIGPVAWFIKSTLIGNPVPFLGSYRMDVMDGLVGAVLSYCLALFAVWLFAQIVSTLAPTFGGQKDPLLALKAAAYAMTAFWVASAATVIPIFGMAIMIAGAAYSVYLLYLGLPVTMKAPEDKVVGYTAVSAIIAVAIYWVTGIIVGLVIGGGQIEDWARNVEEAGKH